MSQPSPEADVADPILVDTNLARTGDFATGIQGIDSPGGSAFLGSQMLPVVSRQDFKAATDKTITNFADVDTGKATGKRAKLVELARKFQGLPYVWGGSSPTRGFDCSGFVQYVYKQMGINLPRVSYQQANSGKRVGLGALQPGDLVAWDNSSRNNGADHIAIYLGNGYIAESPRSGVPNRIRKLKKNESAWGVHFNF